MPNPKRRHSQQRSAKRRTHYKAQIETLSTDKITGETHMRHRAHWVENKMYRRFFCTSLPLEIGVCWIPISFAERRARQRRQKKKEALEPSRANINIQL